MSGHHQQKQFLVSGTSKAEPQSIRPVHFKDANPAFALPQNQQLSQWTRPMESPSQRNLNCCMSSNGFQENADLLTNPAVIYIIGIMETSQHVLLPAVLPDGQTHRRGWPLPSGKHRPLPVQATVQATTARCSRQYPTQAPAPEISTP